MMDVAMSETSRFAYHLCWELHMCITEEAAGKAQAAAEDDVWEVPVVITLTLISSSNTVLTEKKTMNKLRGENCTYPRESCASITTD